MGRVVRVTDPEEAVRLFEAGMLYWHYTEGMLYWHCAGGIVPLGPSWAPHNIRNEIKFCPITHRLVYIVEEDEEGDSPTANVECDSATTDSED